MNTPNQAFNGKVQDLEAGGRGYTTSKLEDQKDGERWRRRTSLESNQYEGGDGSKPPQPSTLVADPATDHYNQNL